MKSVQGLGTCVLLGVLIRARGWESRLKGSFSHLYLLLRPKELSLALPQSAPLCSEVNRIRRSYWESSNVRGGSGGWAPGRQLGLGAYGNIELN